MRLAGSAGTGNNFNVSFVPTAYTRALGRSIPNGYSLIWDALRACSPFPNDLNDSQLNSLFEQLVCHIAFAPVGGGNSFDLEAYHPETANVALWISSRCNWDPSSDAIKPYVGHIIQSNDDPSGVQRPSWVLVGQPRNWHRQWIPSIAVYNCFKNYGTLGPDQLSGLLIADYIPPDTTTAQCNYVPPSTAPTPAPPTSPPSAPPSTPPSAPPTNTSFSGGYVIGDSYYGGTWPRTDPNDGTWYPHSTRPGNAADYWWANGLGVGFSCGAYAGAYTVHISGRTETWNTWLRSTDTWGGRVTGLWVPSAVANGVNVNGIPPGMPAC